MVLRVLSRIAAVVTVLMLTVSALPIAEVSAQTRPYADPAFQQIWERYDRPVELKFTSRSWTWGPNTPFNGYEPYKQGKPAGRRLVQYFDKTRMEINDPSVERDNPFYVTNGLLVRELVSGKIALGDTPEDVEVREPAQEAVAGDPAAVNDEAPTYATFKDVASLANDRPAESRIGEKVNAMITPSGTVRTLPSDQASLANAVKIAVFEPTLKHNIPDKFWDFLNQKGMVYENGKYIQDGTVFQPWVYAMGVPVTEPYWVQTRVGGITRWVLVQLYERRVLTYTPTNPLGFEVEMGNVGQHYYRWRYRLPSEDSGAVGERPQITSLERTMLTATSVRIEWKTSKPTTSRLEYGLTTSYGSAAGGSELKTEHAVDITGLTPNTTYHYTILSRDRDGRTVDDQDHTFKTLAS